MVSTRFKCSVRVSGSLNDGPLNTVATLFYVNSPKIAPKTVLYDICLEKAESFMVVVYLNLLG